MSFILLEYIALYVQVFEDKLVVYLRLTKIHFDYFQEKKKKIQGVVKKELRTALTLRSGKKHLESASNTYIHQSSYMLYILFCICFPYTEKSW